MRSLAPAGPCRLFVTVDSINGKGSAVLEEPAVRKPTVLPWRIVVAGAHCIVLKPSALTLHLRWGPVERRCSKAPGVFGCA